MANDIGFVEAAAFKIDDLRAAKQEWSARLLRPARTHAARALTAAVSPAPEQNVVGVGIGEKLSDGKPTGVMAIKFFVRIKYDENQVDSKNLLPKTVDGMLTDVEQVGQFRRLVAAKPARKARPATAAQFVIPNPRVKMRPARPGSSVGFQDPANQFVMAGTFGVLVKSGNSRFVLSNNHVLADENRLPLGSPIFQPGLLDGGDPNNDQIATLTRFIELDPNRSNKVDAAIARLLNNSLATRDILFIGRPRAAAAAQIDMTVHKFGRTTSYTVGRVTSIDTDVSVAYDTGVFTFANQIIIVGRNNRPFSASGDSGSLILERATNRAVGLLFAGSSSHTIANHIGDVLQSLSVTLV